jgi:hypothetical protein
MGFHERASTRKALGGILPAPDTDIAAVVLLLDTHIIYDMIFAISVKKYRPVGDRTAIIIGTAHVPDRRDRGNLLHAGADVLPEMPRQFQVFRVGPESGLGSVDYDIHGRGEERANKKGIGSSQRSSQLKLRELIRSIALGSDARMELPRTVF